MTIDQTTLELLKAKKELLIRMIEDVERQKTDLISQKTVLVGAKQKIGDIIAGTITGDNAIKALAEALAITG